MYAPFDFLFEASKRKNAKGLLLCSAGEIHPGALQIIPFLRVVFPLDHGFHLANHHPQLRNRVLGIGRDCQPFLRPYTMNWWRVPAKGPSKPR
jgi:hypothetical protein